MKTIDFLKELFNNLKKEGKERDETLYFFFNHKELKKLVSKVIMEGGGDKTTTTILFKKCIIELDRVVRRNEWNNHDTLFTFFERIAKSKWGEELVSTKAIRNQVLEFVSTDKKLRDKVIDRITSNKGRLEEAEDCYQNALLSLDDQLQLGKYKGGAIKGYFYTLAYNIWRNELRKIQLLTLPDGTDMEEVQMETPHSVLEQKENDEHFKRAFQELSENCQELLRLKFLIIKKLQMEDIAKLTGFKNAQNASNALAKCKQKFLEKIEKLDL